MATATESDLHLVELRAENWKRLVAFRMTLNGKHGIIRGKNTAGKTSCCDALFTLLCGADSRKIPEPVRRGEAKAVLEADLGDIVVKRVIKENGEQRLEVRAADGSKVARPQQLLDALRGSSIDVIGFMDARPQDQVDTVLSVCDVRPPVEAVREATGEDHPAKEGESADAYLARLSADDVGMFFVRRRDAGRIADQKQKALAEQETVVRSFGDVEEGGSASDLLEQIQALQAEQDARREAQNAAEAATVEHHNKASMLAELERSLHEKDREIGDLEAKLELARKEKATIFGRVQKGREVVAELLAERESLKEAAAKLPDHATAIAGLRAKVRQAEQQTAERAKYQAAVEQERRLTLEAGDASSEHERLDAVLNRLRYLRAHLLDDVQLGIPGLEVGQGELRLNGLSLRSASTAEALTVAVAVATRQESRLKVLWIDQGERLDTEHRELLLKLAGDAGWQVVLTVVSDDEEPVIEIVDGEAA